MRKLSLTFVARIGGSLLLASGISLPLAGTARADGYVPKSASLTGTSSKASVSIVEPAAPPQLLPAASHDHGPAAAIDGEGRNLSVTFPTSVTLYGVARADKIPARTVLTPEGSGGARLGLKLDDAVASPGGAGGYIGVVPISLDYN